MPSSPLGSTNGQTTSGVACHHCLCAAQAVGRRRAWHAIIALGQHTTSNDVWRGMPSSPLGSTHGRKTSGVACHHRLWEAHTVERCCAGHDITALGHHTRSSTSGMAWHHRPWIVHTIRNVGRGITSPPLESTHNRMTSGVACHHRLWEAHTVKRCRPWHAIIALGQHTRSNNVGRGMPSSPLGSTHGRMTSGVACHHHL